ncbi:GNAT family N-acetyltransferase [Pseudoruegeria sp. SHC-113]|uniref:GNAT family N-acetyltransferase n=1 Tax=Pseudoruegeria sp. SHC-113 TaxID=2855439 RepID=UPI0021BA929B|nr:GNAT family N-acetyltransferase [Pseudoruegeria sp. SHC-113]MCT8158606.1 GNAT family N-acetyltransferase [Pseudoruegeria sp. SHC-113]
MGEVRKAGPSDCSGMAEILNEIIAEGGTTALTEPVTAQVLKDWMAAPGRSAWHVALDGRGAVIGFQWLGEQGYLPPEAIDIATFVKRGQAGLGIGSALFDATRQASMKMDAGWINANIRADNEGGLIYYQSRGFRTYDHWQGYKMANGQVVDKVLKRFDLD